MVYWYIGLVVSATLSKVGLETGSLPADHFLEIQVDSEKRLTQIAANAGTDAERLVKDAALRLLEKDAISPHDDPRATAELPLWHLGSLGPHHRRDIYEDAR